VRWEGKHISIRLEFARGVQGLVEHVKNDRFNIYLPTKNICSLKININ
jgi:hypothetical protein